MSPKFGAIRATQSDSKTGKQKHERSYPQVATLATRDRDFILRDLGCKWHFRATKPHNWMQNKSDRECFGRVSEWTMSDPKPVSWKNYCMPAPAGTSGLAMVLSVSRRIPLLQRQQSHPLHLVYRSGLAGPDFELPSRLLHEHLNPWNNLGSGGLGQLH